MLVYSQTILRAQCDIPRATWQNETQHSETPELLSVIFKVCALCVWGGGGESFKDILSHTSETDYRRQKLGTFLDLDSHRQEA